MIYRLNLSDNLFSMVPAGIYLLKVCNKNTRTRCEMCSKVTVKTPERHHWSKTLKTIRRQFADKFFECV